MNQVMEIVEQNHTINDKAKQGLKEILLENINVYVKWVKSGG